MRLLINELEFSNDENNGRKNNLNYVWIGKNPDSDPKKPKSKYYDFVGTIDTRAQANKLIRILQRTKFKLAE